MRIKELLLVISLGVVTLGSAQEPINKFSDPVIRQIHDLADHRDVNGLFPFLQDTNLRYRGETLMVLGSCWGVEEASVSLLDSIESAMQSTMDGIRMAGAFALGQSFMPEAAVTIKRLIEQEDKPLVKGMLFDALGKCGTSEDLAWLLDQSVDFQGKEGLSMGIFRFGMRGMSSPDGNDRMATIVAEGGSLAGLIYATYYLGRYADLEWLQANAILIRQLLDKERDPVIRSQLIRAVIKAEDEEAWPLVEHMLTAEEDYRVKVNIMNSMQWLPWNKAAKHIYRFAMEDHPGLAVAAAEAIQQHAVYTDLPQHLKAIDAATDWRSRALLIAKGLELVEGKRNLTRRLEKKLFAYFEEASHPSEKAWLLKGLSSYPAQYQVLTREIEQASAPVITTAALETLISMHVHESFATVRDAVADQGVDLDQEFLDSYKKAIASGDIPMVSLAAAALRNPDLNFKDRITDFGFLKDALDQMQGPDQVEARNELVYTLAFFMDRRIPPMRPPGYNHPIDWERVKEIQPNQQIAFLTSKGEVVVQLNVNWCPGTIAAFLELIERGFFNGRYFHRVVPNFVVQDGCPRGDGWGGPEFTIRSEFTPAPFVEGSLGMASAGQDTEGSQWYFTHSPTPHLDGKYTNFGYVVAGMEVVHQLQIGDIIERIEILK